MRFVKSHGLGNDYLVLAAWELPAPLDQAAVRLLCDRHVGVGADGLLLVTGRTEPYGVRIFNPDGSEAEKSGNGLRILAKYLVEEGLAVADAFAIRTPGGEVRALVHRAEGAGGRSRVVAVTVEMGRATFASPAVPVSGPPREVVDEPLAVDGQEIRVTALSLGNPHCVVFVDRLDAARLEELGPRLERHPTFPRRTNVQLARVAAPDRIEALVWERGVGRTLASGSSACAVAAAAVRLGRCGRRVTVVLPGGPLEVEVGDDFSLRLAGPVEGICEGRLSPDLLARLGWDRAAAGGA
ncbi:MAG TPA: diaminopimelate epimerase [Thermodesulfobacteriota bacterium]|nr:diaminopimelate epimerase [Thermodesulfobacteriota bacterium]